MMPAMLLPMAIALASAPSDVPLFCNPVDAQQHRLCKMKEAGDLFGVPAEMRFIETDMMTMRRVEVVYAFPPQRRAAVERAIRAGLPSATERVGAWGHADDARNWTTPDRRYEAEMDNGKFTVRVSGRTPSP